MLVYVVTELHVVMGVYTKERRALALQEELARDGINTRVCVLQLNEEQDSGTQDEGGEV